ncbi:MAG: band 7 protein [Latescibacteria bacterium DG_63]|nr:MAG: band 7 protein [Latescibacteria bacterium DG_63]
MPVLWIVIIAVAAALFIVWALNYRKVGPNEALIISGGRRRTIIEPDGTKRTIGYRVQIGGGTFVMPLVERAQVLPMDIFPLALKTEEVLTAHGVVITAEAQGQVRVADDEPSIRLAAQQFLTTGASGIKSVATEVLEGHFRAMLGTMSVEEIYQQRERFASEVKRIASEDFSRMGLSLVSFALKDISDTQGYIEALGAPKIAQVKRDAAVAQAETEKDAAIKSAVARKDGDIARLIAETEVAQASRDFEARRAEFQATVNEKRAAADLAYELERIKMTQQIKQEEAAVKMIEKEKAIDLEAKEIERRERELVSTVKKPADAMAYQAKLEAEAEAYRQELEAKGKAAGVRLRGAAEAEALAARGEAEARAMLKKADSWSKYNQAAVYETIMQTMPELARAVSEPLSKVEKIVLVGTGEGAGASKITGQVASVVAQLPAIIESLTGTDIKTFLENLPGPRQGEVTEKGSQKKSKDRGKEPLLD